MLRGEIAYLLVVPGFVVCAMLVPYVRRLAYTLGAVDLPGDRRVHEQPIPRLGGIAIFASFIITLILAAAFGWRYGEIAVVNPRGLVGFATAATLVFALGIFDDIKGVRPLIKLLVEIAAALIAVAYGGCRVLSLSTPGGALDLGGIGIPLTVAWIAVVTNAINLMDGLDGLAAGVSAIALVGIIAVAGQERTVTLLAVALLGSSLGFLLHNFHPASIFMGDSGSLFLGFSIGVLSTYAGAKARTGGITIIPLVLLALPLADTAWAVARRYLRGLLPLSWRSHVAGVVRIFLPDRLHIHHRLLAAGFSQRQAIVVLYGIQIAACIVAGYLVLVWGAGVSHAGP